MEFRIDVIVDPRQSGRGLRTVERSLTRIERQADVVGRRLKQAFVGFGVIRAAQGLRNLADEAITLQNRLRTVTDDTDQLADVQARLLGIANDTRTSFSGSVTLYQRLSLATRDLGTAQSEILGITKSVNQALILSGASAKEANNGLIQLSQGIAANRLGGDELRSVLEQLPVIADVIAKRLGVTRGELRAFGQEGKITADVIIGAFQDAREELEEQFAETVPTLGQAFTIARNNALAFVSAIDQAAGITGGLARAIITLSGNLATIARTLVAVGTGFAALRLIPIVENFIKLNKALRANIKLGDDEGAILLNSARARKLKAAADLEGAVAARTAAAAEVTRLKSLISQTRAEVASNASVVGRNKAILALAATEQRLIPVRAQLTQATNSLAAAEARLAAAQAGGTGTVSKAAEGFKKLVGFINPTKLLVAGIAALLVGMSDLEEITNVVTDGLSVFGSVFGGILSFVTGRVSALSEALTGVGVNITQITLAAGTLTGVFVALTASNPFVAAAAGAAALVLSLGQVKGILDDINQAQADARGETQLTATGRRLVELSERRLELEARLRQVQAVTARGNSGEAAIRRERNIRQELRRTITEQENLQRSLRERRQEEARDGATRAILEELRERARLLNINSQAEREVQTELAKRQEALSRAGTPLPDRDQQRIIADALRAVQVREEEREILDSLRGPLEERARLEERVASLLERQVITQAEANRLLAESDPTTDTIRQLELENQLLQVRGATKVETEGLAAAVALVNSLLAQGTEVTPDEARRLLGLQTEIALRNELASVLQRAADPLQQNLTLQSQLTQAFQAGIVSAEDYAIAIAQLQAEEQELSRDFGAGITRGIREFAAAATDFGAIGERLTGQVVTGLSNALAELGNIALQGSDEFDSFGEAVQEVFRELALSVLKSVQQILAQLLILQAISAVTGIPVQTLAGLAGGANQAPIDGAAADGGSFRRGDRVLVGEEGPEIVEFPQAGNVIPNDQSQAIINNGSGQPVVNVGGPTVNVPQQEPPVVILDPGDLLEKGFLTPAGERALVRAVENNPSRIQSALQS